MKEYLVSLSVSFDTPVSVQAKSEKEAEQKGKTALKGIFAQFKKKLDDVADFTVEVDFVECQE